MILQEDVIVVLYHQSLVHPLKKSHLPAFPEGNCCWGRQEKCAHAAARSLLLITQQAKEQS